MTSTVRRALALSALIAAPAFAQQPTVARAEATPRGAVTVRRDSATRADLVGYRRETFAYDAAGRRDPFVSLVTTGVLRPTIADLALVGVAYAPRGGSGSGQSVAIFRDRQTKEQYRVRVGQPLGRMRVASIEPRRVRFTIDEFGISRQESIEMGDSTRTITPTRAP